MLEDLSAGFVELKRDEVLATVESRVDFDETRERAVAAHFPGPTRIDRILNMIKVDWLSNPDLRLGQIISALNADIRQEKGLPIDDDPWYLEDDDLEKHLRERLSGKAKCPE